MNSSLVIFSKLCNLSIQNNFSDSEFVLLYNMLGDDRAVSMATKAKMLPFIAKACLKSNISTNIWKPIYKKFSNRNNKVIEALDIAFTAFKKYGIKKAFLSENFGALLSSNSDFAVFASGDVDCYVDPSEYEKVSMAFAELGFLRKERYSKNLLISSEFSHDKILPENFSIGIDLFPLSRLSMPCFIQTDNFVDWNKMRRYGTTAIVLPPIEALMYICLLHISLHSFCRAPAVRLYRDIVNCAIGMQNNDWQSILKWAERDRVRSRISMAAYISSIIGKVKIPPEIIALLNKQIFDLVFDSDDGILRDEPDRINVLKIEALCNDNSIIDGIREIVFPDSAWMTEVYGENNIITEIKHIFDIL